jgi:putative ABC transport system permease protein
MFPDYERYGILWMGRTALSHAYDMQGAFNYAVLTLTRDADEKAVMDRIDALLGRYGGIGSFAREHQPSHRFLAQELEQLENLSGIFPIIFLGVAAFLLNVVVTRLVGTQREQIAALKAFGYANTSVALHYLQIVMMIVLAGIVLGIIAGAWLGVMLSEIFAEYFRLPFVHFQMHPLRIIQASLITVVAGLLGTLAAVRASVRLKPAEAMRPEAPSVYRTSLIEKMGLQHLLSTPTRMILRNLGHKPVKSLLSVLGIALAVAMLMTGRFQENTTNYMMDLHYGLSQRDDLAVGFSEPTSRRALTELQSLQGVEYGEPVRTLPARLRFEHREYRVYISAFEPGTTIKRLVDSDLNIVELPRDGIVLNEYRAEEILGIETGELLTVEILEGSMPVRRIPVAALIRQDLGIGAYMDLDALNRLMQEGDVISGAFLYIDDRYAFRDPNPGDRKLSPHHGRNHAVLDLRGDPLFRCYRGGRGLQQRAYHADRTQPRTGQPARAGLHAWRNLLHPARRTGIADPGRHTAGSMVRPCAVRLYRRRYRQRNVPRTPDSRAVHLCFCRTGGIGRRSRFSLAGAAPAGQT